MPKLAIKGGRPIRRKPFPNMTTIGPEEAEAVQRVMKSGNLSSYRGNWSENFYGGPEIKALEAEWSKHFGCMHSIAVNSATSGLHIACKAIGLKPGDEVIVTPWSMSCSATAPLLCGAIPVFADISQIDYNLNPGSIEERITEETKAIIVVDLFGHPHQASSIREIADKYGLYVIEDASQAIGSYYENRPTGTLGDIGIFSFTQGKHITSGEGGMMVANNYGLAFRCQMIRNHAEAVENDLHYARLKGAYGWGFNMRMTEIQAAILREQLKKLPEIVGIHIENAKFFKRSLADIRPIHYFSPRANCSNSYYVQTFTWNKNMARGVHRDKYIEAVKAELAPEQGREREGVPIGCGYIKPLYLFPIFQNSSWPSPRGNYQEGSCSVAEELWKERLFLHRLLGVNLTQEDLQDVADAFLKVWENINELR